MEEKAIRYLKGVGPRREAVFNSVGVYSLRDLLYYFPFRYQDRTSVKKIAELVIGEFAVCRGTVRTCHLRQFPYFVRTTKVRNIFEIILEDETASVPCVWFNQGYLADTVKAGDELMVYGRLQQGKQGQQIVAPEFEKNPQADSLGVGRIIGIYRLPAVFSQRFMRNAVREALDACRSTCVDAIPFTVRRDKNIPNIAQSLEEMHFPTSWEAAAKARERFIFEELFFSQVLVYLRKARHRRQQGMPCRFNPETLDALRRNFSHTLIDYQERVVAEICADLAKPYPMHRLLQGDVGCGKTLDAAFAVAVCADST